MGLVHVSGVVESVGENKTTSAKKEVKISVKVDQQLHAYLEAQNMGRKTYSASVLSTSIVTPFPAL